MDYTDICKYWNFNLCAGGNKDFPFSDWKDKKVLEIGCGAGNDTIRFVKSGADYIGIDLTKNAAEGTSYRLQFFQNNNIHIYEMNAENLLFNDNYFDLVYSWGVIHHAINPEKIISEIFRVLKPNGKFYIMLYNKLSIRYYIDIMFLRKLLWWLHYPKYRELRKENPHPSKEQWISWNTDTLGCPLARAYHPKEALKLFKDFREVKFTWNLKDGGWFGIWQGIK